MAWQPISTAPKDGTVVLAWGRGDGPGASPWVEKVCYFLSPDNAEDVPLDAYCWTLDADGCEAEPEGWMPLPAPPQADDAVDPVSRDSSVGPRATETLSLSAIASLRGLVEQLRAEADAQREDAADLHALDAWGAECYARGLARGRNVAADRLAAALKEP